MATDTAGLVTLLMRSRAVIADVRAVWVESLRASGQTDADVLADTDHESIDDPSYADINAWTLLLTDIDAALGVPA